MLKKLSKPMQNNGSLLRKRLEALLAYVGDMSLKRRAKRIIEEVDPKDREKIIDLGCGTGYYLFLLSNLPVLLELTGLDNDQKAIGEAKELLPSKNIKFILGDLHRLPFKDQSFDKAVMSEVLEHVEGDVQVLKEVYRILKRGGTLVISVPSINFPFFWDPINWVLQHFFNTHIKKGFFSGLWSGHLRLYSLQELEKKFKKAGFRLEITEELTYWCLPFNHYLVNLVARLLYDVKISPTISQHISKFKSEKRPLLFEMVFNFINWIDKLNKIFPQKTGVNVFIKAIKI